MADAHNSSSSNNKEEEEEERRSRVTFAEQPEYETAAAAASAAAAAASAASAAAQPPQSILSRRRCSSSGAEEVSRLVSGPYCRRVSFRKRSVATAPFATTTSSSSSSSPPSVGSRTRKFSLAGLEGASHQSWRPPAASSGAEMRMNLVEAAEEDGVARSTDNQ